MLTSPSKSFYLRYRQGGINAHVVYAAWLLESPPDLYVSEKDFDERGSSKEKAVIKLIGHHSNPENHQSNPLNWSKEGTWEVTKRTPDPPIHTPTGIVKFVVYTEFVGMMPYIKSVGPKVPFVLVEDLADGLCRLLMPTVFPMSQ